MISGLNFNSNCNAQGVYFYVTPSGAGDKDGTSWANAADGLTSGHDIASIYADANNVDVNLWVAAGTYTGTGSESAFTASPNVLVYGGFVGNEDPATFDLGTRNFVANASILDGQGTKRVLYMGLNNTICKWDGFTIQNGALTDKNGAGVYISNNSELRNCVIKNNTVTASTAYVYGGGVYMSTGKLINCEIYGNTITSASYRNIYGGGVYADNATVENCTIRNNTANNTYNGDYSNGGGLYAKNRTFVRKSSIYENNSTGQGGGVYSYGQYSAYAEITNCTIRNNTSAKDGGGVYLSNYNTMTGCLVANNTSAKNGGGVCAASNCDIVNCDIVNNLITDNTTNTSGAGIYFSGSLPMTNSIIWGNKKAGVSNQIGAAYSYYLYDISYSAIEGGYSGIGNITLSAGNTGSDMSPKFTEPSSEAGAASPSGDWTLQDGSVLINKGTAYNITLPEFDLAGNSRIRNDIVDLGAYESSFNGVMVLTPDANNVIYVTAEGAGNKNGSSWENATLLQYAVSRAATLGNKPKIWVKQGIYIGVAGSDNAFFVAEGVKVYGGFAGNEDPVSFDINTRNFVSNASILDGQNAQRVLYQQKDFTNTTAALWDGFTIQHGYVPNGWYGGGAFIKGYCNLSNCKIINNTGSCSGGLYIVGKSETAMDTVRNCVISNNTSAYSGYGSSYGGAGVNCSNTVIYNSLISNNTCSANQEGSGVYANQYVKLVNCNIVNNLCNGTTSRGGYHSSSYNSLINSVVWGNKYNNGVDVISGTRPTVINCAIENGYSGIGNIPLSSTNTGTDIYHPNFVSPSEGAGAAYSEADWTLSSSSILINNGTQNTTGLPVLDINNSARVKQGRIDIGAYESNHEAAFCITPDAGNIIYVKTDGSGNGSSWANATCHLQVAVNAAGAFDNGTQVWVAAGTYNGLDFTSGDAFYMAPHAKVYGGFAGNETLLSERDFRNNETILNGQSTRRVLNQDFDYTANTRALWDGFTIKNGKTSTNNNGAGVNMMAYSDLRNCVVTDNVCGSNGTINVAGNSAKNDTIQNVIVKNNIAQNGGGINSSNAYINNCLVYNNSATYSGGIRSSNTTILNTTIVNNQSTNSNNGCGFYATGTGNTIINSVIWGNKIGTSYSQIAGTDSYITILYSAIQGGYAGTCNIMLDEANTGGYLSPKFVSLTNNNFSLQAGSILINKGFIVHQIVDEDLAGNNRVQYGKIDIGAYESASDETITITADENDIVYVKKGGTGNGSSWANATPDLNFAVSAAAAMQTKPDIWVAKGTYYGYDNVYGGFAGNEEANFNLDNRNFVENQTILDGDNKRRVLNQRSNFASSEKSSTWDGFTITNGNLFVSGDEGKGAGVKMKSFSHLKNCRIINNSNNNTGGVYSSGNNTNRNTLTNCEISNNTATNLSNGGGVYAYYTDMTNCKVTENTASGSGGGIYAQYSNIMNCLVANNNATSYGGGIYASISTNITNSTIVGNYSGSTSNGGGGLYLSTAYSSYTNLIVWGNTSKSTTAVQIYPATNAPVNNSAVQGGYVITPSTNINLEAENDGGYVEKKYVRFLDVEHGVYRLGAESACIGIGKNDV